MRNAPPGGGSTMPRFLRHMAAAALALLLAVAAAPAVAGATLKTASAKEFGKAEARCDTGQVITAIIKPIYGNLGQRCNFTTSYRHVAMKCLRRSSCAVPAVDQKFGRDICKRAKKTLTFQYTCGPAGGPVPAPRPNHSPPPSPKPQQTSSPPPPRPRPPPPRARPRPMPSPPPQPIPRPYPPPTQPNPTPTPEPEPSPTPPSGNAYYSPFWGRNGSNWSPTSRLADWSYAGYMGLKRAIPNYPAQFNVVDFGAKGDNVTDDTQAFLDAIEAASQAAYLLNTYDCSTQYRQKRCMIEHDGFLNQGREGVAVLVPPGVYRITRSLTIKQSNVVLRGASKEDAILYMPKSLQAIYGSKQAWSFGGGFVFINGHNAGGNSKQYQLTPVTADADKGSTRLQVGSTAGIEVGQWMRLYALAPSPARRRQLLQQNGTAVAGTGDTVGLAAANSGARQHQKGLLPLTPALRRQVAMAAMDAEAEVGQAGEGVQAAAQSGTLDAYLYGDNLVDSGTNAYEGTDHIRFSFKVVAKGSDWIELERPLTYNIRTRWQVYVYQFYARVQHSGIENLTFQFPWDIYPEHLEGKGYNAIHLASVANCWARNIDIINADNGIFVSQADFVSVQHILMSVERPRWSQSTYPDNGHHALGVGRSGDVSFTFFNIANMYMHDLSVDGFAERNVFASGQGEDMNIDCHRGGPHNNLFSALRLGKGTRPFHSGGHKSRGAYAGANNTFWNVGPSTPGGMVPLPACDFGPLLNFIGSYKPPAKDSRYVDAASANPAGGMQRIRAADAHPQWCPETKWQVNLVPSGQVLQPQNIFTAMTQTRKRRLG